MPAEFDLIRALAAAAGGGPAGTDRHRRRRRGSGSARPDRGLLRPDRRGRPLRSADAAGARRPQGAGGEPVGLRGDGGDPPRRRSWDCWPTRRRGYDYAAAVMRGLTELADGYGVTLAGGDTATHDGPTQRVRHGRGDLRPPPSHRAGGATGRSAAGHGNARRQPPHGPAPDVRPAGGGGAGARRGGGGARDDRPLRQPARGLRPALRRLRRVGPSCTRTPSRSPRTPISPRP